MQQALLSDIAEFQGTWQFCMWPIVVGSQRHRITDRRYNRSSMGHYYHPYWHPLAVGQPVYVMDDFGQLQQVYEGEN